MAIQLDDLQIDIVVNASKAETGLDKLASSLKNVGKGANLKSAISDIKDMGTATATSAKVTETASSTMKSSLASIASKLKTIGKTAIPYIGNFAKALVTVPIKKLGEDFSRATQKIAKFGSQIKRVAMMRAIRAALRFITTALKEGVSALIEWDRTYGNNTSYAARTADEIAAKWGEVKKSFGAAAMPLIQLVQPALMAVMNTAIEVANIINQIFRSLQGYSTYMKATTGAIGDSAKAATGAAKELKRVIFGFDELNILPSDNGGGGGGANSNAGLIDFIETDMDRMFDGSLANMINELIDSISPRDLAKSLAEKVNTAISSVNNFLKELDFLKIGQTIGEFLSTAFAEIDWNGLGQIFVRRITALPTVLIGAIQKLNLGNVGSAIYQFLKGAIETAIEWIRSIDWAQTMYNLFSQLGDLIKNLNPIELVGKILVFAFEVVKAVISGVAGAFAGLLKSAFDLAGIVGQWLLDGVHSILSWADENIATPIKGFFTNLWNEIFNKTEEIAGKTGKTAEGVFDGVKKGVDGMVSTVRNTPPLQIALTIATGGLAGLTAKAWRIMQDRLNNNPLTYSTTIGNAGVNTNVILARQSAIAQEFASGGVPDVGTLFYAGEAGAELVANMSNGRTGVMNVGQMEQAVANGNIDVVNAIYAMANMLTRELRDKDMNAYISQDAIGQAATKYQNNQLRRGVAY